MPEAEVSLDVAGESPVDDDSPVDSGAWPAWRTTRGSSLTEDPPQLSRELLKVLFLGSIIVTMIIMSEEVGRLVLSAQSALSVVPLSAALVAMVAVSGPRRAMWPLYYVFPFSTLCLLYLVEKVGWVRGGLLYQCVLLSDDLWFVMIRWLWKPFMAAVTDPSNEKSRRCVPRDLLRALGTLDSEWGHRIAPMSLESYGSILVLSAAWGTDEQITLYFLCTRFDLSWAFFAFSWTSGLILRLPENLVRARAIKIIAADFASLKGWRRGLEKTPVWLIVLWACIAIVSTLIVHAVHAQLILEWGTGTPLRPRRRRRRKKDDGLPLTTMPKRSRRRPKSWNSTGLPAPPRVTPDTTSSSEGGAKEEDDSDARSSGLPNTSRPPPPAEAPPPRKDRERRRLELQAITRYALTDQPS